MKSYDLLNINHGVIRDLLLLLLSYYTRVSNLYKETRRENKSKEA